MSTPASPAPRLLPSADYVAEATRLIRSARRRVTLFTMIMTADNSTDEFIDALCEAARRGVTVRVTNDIFTLGVLAFETSGAPWRNSGIRSARAMRRSLKKSGVRFAWVGQLGPILYARRTHVKWCLVDDYVFSFGGVNLYKNGIQNLDYMVLVHDAALANRLEQEHERIHQADRVNKFYRSHSFECRTGTVLVDGGMFNNSIIYERACALARQARSAVFVSQYRPTGKLAGYLAAIDSQLYYNRWQTAFGMNKLLLRLGSFTRSLPTSFVRTGYIHAKYIIYTLPDGQKVALTGSHNFESGGVLLGTREIALETRSPEIIDQLEAYHRSYIA